MKAETAIRVLKTEKGCVNIDCKYCTENKKCYLQQLIEETEKLKAIIEDLRKLSFKTYDVADFQQYFDKLDGKDEWDL